jgi:hypothetical protein
MKKTFKFLGLTLAVLFVFAVIGCEEEEKPEPVAYTSSGIPIYAGTGVTNAEAVAKKGDIDIMYGKLGASSKTDFDTRIKKIIIVSGTKCSADKAAQTLTVGKDAAEMDILSAFAEMLARVIDNSRNTVRMAKAFVASAVNAKSI